MGSAITWVAANTVLSRPDIKPSKAERTASPAMQVIDGKRGLLHYLSYWEKIRVREKRYHEINQGRLHA